MRTPPTIEGRVWLQKYSNAFLQWAQSGNTDKSAFAEAAAALRSLLERCPDYAAEVAQIASVACFVSRRADARDLIVKLAECGLEADGLVAEAGQSSNAAALLLLSMAEAELHAERRLSGLDALKRLQRRIDGARETDPLELWIKGRMHVLLGELHELGLEEEQARSAYRAASQEIEPLLVDGDQRTGFIDRWAIAMGWQAEGTKARRQATEEIALPELTTLATQSAIGLARNTGPRQPREAQASAARAAWRALEAYGPPPDLSPFDVIPVIGALPHDEAMRFGPALVATIERRRVELERGDIPPSIRSPAAIALVKAAQQRQVKLLERQQAVYEVVAKLGLALAFRSEGDLVEAQRTVIESIGMAMKTRLGGPQVCAFGIALEIEAALDRQHAADVMDIFFIALAGTIKSDPAFFASPRLRALLDNAIAVAAALTAEKLGKGGDIAARRHASAILDLQRRPDSPPPEVLMPPGKMKPGKEPESAGVAAAQDTLGRIQAALNERKDTVSIVIQSVGSEVAFLVLSSGAMPVQHFLAGPDYQVSAQALTDSANEMVRGHTEGRLKSALEAAGRTAFQALPDAVREAIRSHHTILLAPDFRGRQDIVPFELMHDGEAYLGASRVVARFTSLAHMATTLDTRMRLPLRRRALVISVPVAEGYDSLDLAPLEQEEITRTLTRSGFDAPPINPARVTAPYLLDRLAYVDVLHVSAHGESGAGMEWLVLPKQQRVVVDDLMQRPSYSVPFVYLNTCNLGQTRYLGAGVSRGLAYTFAELGAPAVVAHATPVPDSAALRLAVAFYDNLKGRGVGEALMAARRELMENGESAASWASTILIGDPDHIIDGGEREIPDVASDLLDAFMTTVQNPSKRSAAWVAAISATLQGSNPRVEAALSLVQTMTEVSDLNDPRQAAAFDDAIRVADLLRHLPSRGLLRFIKADRAAEQLGADSAALMEDSIRYLGPLAAMEPGWDGMLSAARQMIAKWRMKERGFELRTHMPKGQEDDGSMRQIMEAVMGAQQAAEEIYGSVAIRETETGIEDILWNAVVAGHPNRFQDIPESVTFAEQVAQKLRRRGFLSAAAMPFATPMLAGLLRYSWDRQNLNYLAPDFAEGQAGTVQALVEDIAANWSPPEGQAWYALMESVPDLIDNVLAFIEGLSWGDIYKHLDSRMDSLAAQLKELLDQVKALHPAALGSCAAYVSGLVMVKNTFSPLEGSVPESVGECMTKVFHALDADNEGRFFGYLQKGFQSVVSRENDELARWRMESGGPPPKAPRKGPVPKRARKSRPRKRLS